MKNKQRTLITGLWKHKNSEGEVFLSGKIGVNLSAIIVKNPDYEEGHRMPEYLLYFGNGRQSEVVCFKIDEEKLEKELAKENSNKDNADKEKADKNDNKSV